MNYQFQSSSKIYLKIWATWAITGAIAFSALQIQACIMRKANDCDKVESESSHRIWLTNNLRNYSFVARRLVGGEYHYASILITVRDGQAVSWKPNEVVSLLTKTDGYEEFDTVEKMFERIRAYCSNGDTITVDYDEKLGYPKHIWIRPYQGATDTQFGIEVTNFVVN